MELKDAIEEVNLCLAEMARDFQWDDFGALFDDGTATAIATILNAVVKGELRTQPEPRKAILNRYAMRNGHTKEQRPDESREDYNLRVYGLREEDME